MGPEISYINTNSYKELLLLRWLALLERKTLSLRIKNMCCLGDLRC